MAQEVSSVDKRQIEMTRTPDPALKLDKIDRDNVGADTLNGLVESVDTNGPEARRVLRKIDTYLLPILAVTYFIQVSLVFCLCRDTSTYSRDNSFSTSRAFHMPLYGA